MTDRKKFGNRLRLIGYFFEVIAIGIWLTVQSQSNFLTKNYSLTEADFDALHVLVIVIVFIGAAFVAGGTFVRIRPQNADEILAERQADREDF